MMARRLDSVIACVRSFGRVDFFSFGLFVPTSRCLMFAFQGKHFDYLIRRVLVRTMVAALRKMPDWTIGAGSPYLRQKDSKVVSSFFALLAWHWSDIHHTCARQHKLLNSRHLL